MSEWRPIDTAPQDGDEILLFTPRLTDNIPPIVRVGRWSFVNKAWDIGEYYPTLLATHWMALPEDPE